MEGIIINHLLPWVVVKPGWDWRRYVEKIWAHDYIEKIGKGQWKLWRNLPCWDLMRVVKSSVFAVNSFLLSEILVSLRFFSSSSVVSFDSVSSPRISTFNSRISSRIASGVAIASQFSPICQSSKSRNVKSGFPNAKGMFKKQCFLPLSQAK